MEKMMFRSSMVREMLLRRNSIQRFIDYRCHFEDSAEIWKFFYIHPEIGLAVAKNFEMGNSDKRRLFIKRMAEPKLHTIFTGFKGSGKTALAYWIAEELNKQYDKKCCLLYPISFNPDALPWFFYPAEDEDDIDNGDFCIFDEAQIKINSRRAVSKVNVDFSAFLTIQRHKDVSMLVIQQDIEMSDVNQFRLSDGFIFKPSGIAQLREKMTKGNALVKFLEFLRPLSQKETLFISSDLQTILLFEHPLPSFWNQDISKITKNISMAQLKTNMDNAKRIKENKVRKLQGKAIKKGTKPKRETEEEILEKEYGKNWQKKISKNIN